jgi:hypothetical protein
LSSEERERERMKERGYKTMRGIERGRVKRGLVNRTRYDFLTEDVLWGYTVYPHILRLSKCLSSFINNII